MSPNLPWVFCDLDHLHTGYNDTMGIYRDTCLPGFVKIGYTVLEIPYLANLKRIFTRPQLHFIYYVAAVK